MSRTSDTRIRSLIRVGSRSGGDRSKRGFATRWSSKRASSYRGSNRVGETRRRENKGTGAQRRRVIRVPFIGASIDGLPGYDSTFDASRELVDRELAKVPLRVCAHRDRAVSLLAIA